MVILTKEDKKVLRQINKYLNVGTDDYSTNMIAEEIGLSSSQVYKSQVRLKKNREID